MNKKTAVGGDPPSQPTQRNAARPPSEMRVDLHVYIIPPELWRDHLQSAVNQVINDTVSAGFIRVFPDASISSLREEIETQIGFDVVPREFAFLKCVGRCFTRIKSKQENLLKVKNFIPPQAYAPEIFILEMTPDIRAVPSSGTASSQSHTSSPNEYRSDNDSLSGHNRVPPIKSNTATLRTGRRGVPEQWSSTESLNAHSSKSTQTHRPSQESPEIGKHDQKENKNRWKRSSSLEDYDPPLSATPNHSPKVALKSQYGKTINEKNMRSPVKTDKQKAEEAERERLKMKKEEEMKRKHEEQKRLEDEMRRKEAEAEKKRHEEEERQKKEQEKRKEEEKRRKDEEKKKEEERRRKEEQKKEEERKRQEEEQRKEQEERRKKEEEERRKKEEEKRKEDERKRREEERKKEEEKRKEEERKRKEEQKKEEERKQREEEQRREQEEKRKKEEEKKRQEQLRKLEEEAQKKKALKKQQAEEKANLLKEIEALKETRQEMEQEQELLTKTSKQLQIKTQANTHNTRDEWKKKYFEEKKKTAPLDEQCNRLKHSLDSLNKKVVANLESLPPASKARADATKVKEANSNSNQARAKQLEHDIEEIQQRLETVKMKLTGEMKLRNQAEKDTKALRAELSQRKLQRYLPDGYRLNRQTPRTQHVTEPKS